MFRNDLGRLSWSRWLLIFVHQYNLISVLISPGKFLLFWAPDCAIDRLCVWGAAAPHGWRRNGQFGGPVASGGGIAGELGEIKSFRIDCVFLSDGILSNVTVSPPRK